MSALLPGIPDERVHRLLERLTVRQRLRQVERWLRSTCPTTLPVLRVRVERIGDGWSDLGECYTVPGGLAIRVQSGQDMGPAIDHLLHEWAHAMSWPTRYAEEAHRRLRRREHPEHPDEFWLAYGRVYRAWHDEDGWRRSGGY